VVTVLGNVRLATGKLLNQEDCSVIRKSVLFAFLFSLAIALPPPSGAADQKKLDKFAQCLTDKKAVMYGAVWCEHCKDQKDMFGDAFKRVTYVECTVNGTRKITDECKSLGIKRTPTWIFPDGDRLEGAIPLDQLGKKAGCSLE
jgi:hypothetical protein